MLGQSLISASHNQLINLMEFMDFEWGGGREFHSWEILNQVIDFMYNSTTYQIPRNHTL